ncbi:MAG: hypothetical protein MI717_08660, partial [Spirochaetales bacterium]|nr:hypothetical protein [Spirochaetales bacterium]
MIIKDTQFTGVWGSDWENIYVVGRKGLGGVIYQHTGENQKDCDKTKCADNTWQGGWEEIQTCEKGLNAICGNGPHEVYIAGDEGLVLYKDNQDKFNPVPFPDGVGEGTMEDLNAIWGSVATGIYAAGEKGTLIKIQPTSLGHVLPLAKNAELAEKWGDTNQYLNYSIQVKQLWGDALEYGVSGISFRWHRVEKDPDLHAGYGISFIRYAPQSGMDMIPEGLKPPQRAGRLLVLLWEQYVQDGEETQRWLAYKDITEDERMIKSNTTPTDLATLVVTVHEKSINAHKINDICVYHA